MEEVTVIFPDQLFADHPAVSKMRVIYLLEEFLFFKSQYFHKQRLVLLRAAMRNYQSYLEKKGFQVHYVESKDLSQRGDFVQLLEKKGKVLHVAEFSDEWLQKDLESFRGEIRYYPTPAFFLQKEEIDKTFRRRDRFSMADFYAGERKRRDLLMEGEKPVGGKFSFDAENRKRLPKGIQLPYFDLPKKDEVTGEAKAYVDKRFPDAIGSVDHFFYPTTFNEAKEWLKKFVEERLFHFGEYEDAIDLEEPFIFHSVLSPMINIGLLTPKEVVDEALRQYERGGIPLNSIEGFIRQVLGWREFMRSLYHIRGSVDRRANDFQHKRKLPKGFWDGTTGIEPIDRVIKRVLKIGYCHHIERLMILGNFLLLTETDPDEVYSWFMGNFVDAYDWVMVPNVYGMSQYASHGVMTTKPYISGSNYILKMSHYPKGEWCDLWDGLFWRFIKKHRPLFEQNHRMSVLLSSLVKNRESIEEKILIAERYLSS